MTHACKDHGHTVLIGGGDNFIVMVDGDYVLPMATSQDHKARDDGDQGPNTVGICSFSDERVVW
jgi:phosphoribosylamine--glycine ligase